jgi:hypothetical protein
MQFVIILYEFKILLNCKTVGQFITWLGRVAANVRFTCMFNEILVLTFVYTFLRHNFMKYVFRRKWCETVAIWHVCYLRIIVSQTVILSLFGARVRWIISRGRSPSDMMRIQTTNSDQAIELLIWYNIISNLTWHQQIKWFWY